MNVRKASKPLQWFLTTFDYWAITMPWKTVHVREDIFFGDTTTLNQLLKHEQTHVDQIEQCGAFVWTVLYLWYNVRYGYRNNPFEVEARSKALM